MIEINPKESTTLNFKVNVSGSNAIPQPRLIIPISKKVSLVFEGKMVEGEVEVNISELLELTDSKKLKGKLEVIIEDNIFYPWEDIIKIKNTTSVKAETVKKPIKESKIKVSANTADSEVIIEDEEDVIEIKPKNLKDMFDNKL